MTHLKQLRIFYNDGKWFAYEITEKSISEFPSGKSYVPGGALPILNDEIIDKSFRMKINMLMDGETAKPRSGREYDWPGTFETFEQWSKEKGIYKGYILSLPE